MRRIEHENIDEAAHGPGAHAARLLLLALFFLAGVLFGTGPVGPGAGHHGGRVRRYLEDYVRLGGEGSAHCPDGSVGPW